MGGDHYDPQANQTKQASRRLISLSSYLVSIYKKSRVLKQCEGLTYDILSSFELKKTLFWFS